LQLKMLAYYMAIWSILRIFGLFCGHLVYFKAIWYNLWLFGIICGHLIYVFYGYLVHFSRFGMLCQEKSDNPAQESIKFSRSSISFQLEGDFTVPFLSRVDPCSVPT
jgi:hypothetical protein